MKVIIDTNFAMYLAKFKLIEELRKEGSEIILLDSVEKELRKISERGKREDRENASLALALLGRMNLKREKATAANVDRSIVQFAKKEKEGGNQVTVGTMDKALSARLKKDGIGVIIIRREKSLQWS